MALEMSSRLGLISDQERDRGIRLFQRAGLPVIPPEEMTEEQQDVFYYITVMNESYQQPAMPRV